MRASSQFVRPKRTADALRAIRRPGAGMVPCGYTTGRRNSSRFPRGNAHERSLLSPPFVCIGCFEEHLDSTAVSGASGHGGARGRGAALGKKLT